MKTVYIYVLILALSLKPIYNIYYLTYYQINTEFIALTFCENKNKVELACNGKCHLAKQLKTDKSSEDGNTLKLQTEIFTLVFFQINDYLQLNSTLCYLDKSINTRYIQYYTYNLIDTPFRPPTA